MQTITLGRTDIAVTDWCLGTMTFGNQTPSGDAHRQIDMALDAGLTFMDCAEMYPVNPVSRETAGRSEEILGAWFAKSGRRADWVLATKVSGPNGGFVRDGAGYTGANIGDAIDASLRRLQTDMIDLYQLHWPDRGSWAFRSNWGYDPSAQDRTTTLDHMHEVLTALDAAVKAGKIRAVGLSNETAWGTTKWCDVAEQHGLPRMAAIQNEYSPLCRIIDTDLSEVMVNEDVTLLSYSPLAAGLLTGKYQDGAVPAASRMSLNGDLGGRKTDRAFDAVQAYLDIAARHDIDPVHMAMAWQATRPFAVSAIFGATTADQLAQILAGRDLVLSEEVVAEIDAAHKAHPMPY
ncbi:Predicted oxidoreductase [Loktanella fryxellensis]|uniref:Predicted oxidoreductase n=1 Tax=Loktanella fryxellensis TaxID=245187 RepID=A0A1H8EQH9_9RHOB|nr:aldo/keto reductase [Loktanella fryxellensis]SEN21759.1 Predicted oxidoreductase [Loktanella fryxellensis]